jgi:RHS repeat-associated protein
MDPNRSTTTTQYDVFGRKTLTIAPDGAWTSSAYHQFGAGVGVQHVQTETVAGLSTWTYFDGLGRPITEKTTGPDGKVIVTQTRYDGRGAVVAQSLPAFDGEASTWKRVTYDAAGRVLRAMQPDGSRTLHCYDAWVTSALDATNHRTRITRDALGRVVQVDEYLGTFATCTTDVGTPYATTQYHYDILGNLLSVTDARRNVTTMRYDTLSRKRSMQDPDMGAWQYAYDPAGNLIQQIDAKDQGLTMQYDALHRLTTKQYVGQHNTVVYQYDDPTPGTYRIGRLFRMQDASGATTFTYDALGRPVTTWQTVRSAPPPAPLRYRTQTRYDALGRVTAVHYPDHSVVQYTYNGPWLERVFDADTTYATYSGYNALGQPARLAFGNGVRTDFTYSQATNPDCPAQNFRLCSLSTRRATAIYQDLHYTYDRAGNIRAIVDGVNGNQTFQYDALHRLRSATGPYGIINYAYDEIGNLLCNSQISPCSATRPNYVYPPSGPESVRPHAVLRAGANSFTYDDNGNMLSGAGRTLVYDPDNRPVRIATAQGTTRFVYDGRGGRVMKTTGTTTTMYIGKLYECTAGQCIKYIFAGDQRLAMQHVESSTVHYYHADHLGSSSVVTDATGRKVQALTYYPFGQTRQDLGTVDVHHKYTGQELDDSTGLYFYNARYYGPSLGRFLTPDTIVQNPYDPQSLNRYAYVRNNPLNLIDPSGHSWLSKAWRKSGAAKWWKKNRYYVVTTAIVVGTAAATWYCGGCGAAAVLQGALVGEISGGALGGYSAHKAGGNVGKGVLFGTVTGGVTGAVGRAINPAFPGLDLSWHGAVEMGKYGVLQATTGAIIGAGSGATAAYAGGVGDLRQVLRGAGYGAALGAALGVALGVAEPFADKAGEAIGKIKIKGYPLKNAFKALDEVFKTHAFSGTLEQVMALASDLVVQAVPYIEVGVLSTGPGLAFLDHQVTDLIRDNCPISDSGSTRCQIKQRFR